ncbi:MAG: LysM peptidoglycan-binding domain-containing protein [Acetatifactor sp.]|nr:LysM peptidoglycan-binding domain-containing protein [Acetatifactor sp.]
MSKRYGKRTGSRILSIVLSLVMMLTTVDVFSIPMVAKASETSDAATCEGEIMACANLVGRAWKSEDEFEFTISSLGESPLPEMTQVTVTKDSAGYTESFGKITFTEAGQYEYVISESHKGEYLGGITYDSSDRTVTIKVKEDEEGNLVADGTELVQTAVFTNTSIESIPYLDPTDEGNANKTQADYDFVTDGTTEMTTGWYVVNANVAVEKRITVSGNVNLILCDGAELAASAGVNVPEGNSLTVWAQSLSENTAGKLTATTPGQYQAGIGGNSGESCGTVTINGGVINANGGERSAGIGGGLYGDGGTVTINGGKVTANGGNENASVTGGAGIGGGGSNKGNMMAGSGGTVIITGGTVYANGFSWAAGIGGGGGNGSSEDTSNGGKGGNVLISGGTVYANGGHRAAGIGGANGAPGGTVEITGGLVVATTLSKDDAQAIGHGEHNEGAGSLTLGDEMNVIAGDGENNKQLFEKSDGVSACHDNYWAKITDVKEATLSVSYVDAAGVPQGPVEAYRIGSYNILGSGWYAVNENVTMDSRLNVKGDVNLILCDGAQLTANEGVGVNKGYSLTIYGQSGQTGALRAAGIECYSAIGSDDQKDSGTIIINGGNVTANGGYKGAGIGGGRAGSGGVIAINGGTVNATGGQWGPGIGGGGWMNNDMVAGYGGDVTITGGTVTAIGGRQSAGIGGGLYGDGGKVTISGGTVTANGGDEGEPVTGGAGIGGGGCEVSRLKGGDGGTVIITGGTVYANGFSWAAGIGGGGGTGNAATTSNGGKGGNVLISGGTVYANGGNRAAGIGGANGAPGGTVTITGGLVVATAIGKTNAQAIGHGEHNEEAGTLTLGDDEMVYAGNSEGNAMATAAADRVSACQNNKYAKIVTVKPLNLSTDENGIYQIKNASDFDELARFVRDGGETAGLNFMQTADINDAVAVMVGTSENPFRGTYDGDNKKLSVNLTRAEAEYYVAPFSHVSGATITNLKVSGSVKGYMHPAGLVGLMDGTGNTITNVLVETNVTVTGTHGGGVVGHGHDSTATLEGVVFTGSVSGGQHVGALWGWSDSANVTLKNCFEDGTYTGTGVNPVGIGGTSGKTISNVLYKSTPVGTPDSNWSGAGAKAYCITSKEPATFYVTDVTVYGAEDFVGTYFTGGLSFDGKYYGGQGQDISLEMSYGGTVPDGCEVQYVVDGGSLEKTDTGYVLHMPAQDVTISAKISATYPLYVGGVQVKTDNFDKLNVNHWSYDPDSNTLTLQDYEFVGQGYVYSKDQGAIIYYEGDQDLTITLLGTNRITPDGTSYGDSGIVSMKADCTLIFNGSGNLFIESTGENYNAAIYAYGSVVVDCSGQFYVGNNDANEGIFVDTGKTVTIGTGVKQFQARGYVKGIGGTVINNVEGTGYDKFDRLTRLTVNATGTALDDYKKVTFPVGDYKVVFLPGEGGSGSMEEQEVFEGETFTFPECKFTAPEGMGFSKWEMSGVDVIGMPGGTEVIVNNCASGGIITVTAKWTDMTDSEILTDCEGKTLVFDGKARQLVTKGSAIGGKMNYAIGTDDQTAPAAGWQETIPEGTLGGTYYVWYKVKGDSLHYDSDAKCAVTTIKAIELTAYVEDREAEYNGSLQQGSSEVTITGLLEGHTAEISYNPASGKLVGVYEGTFDKTSFKVVDADGNDVTGGYVLTTVTSGKLTVKNRTTKYFINVTMNYYSDWYDSFEHTVSGYQKEYIRDGNKFTVEGYETSTVSRMYVGKTDVVVTGTPVVRDEEGNDVTAQFTVTHDEGFVEIKKCKLGIVITSQSKSFDYDGQEHLYNRYEVSVPADPWKTLGNEGTTEFLLNGKDYLRITPTASGVTDVESYDKNNTFIYQMDHADQYDLTVTCNYGTISVNPKAVVITAQSREFSYNGLAQSWDRYDVEGLVGEDAIMAVVTGTITNPAESPVVNKVESYEFTKGTAKNYTVTCVDGELTMKKTSELKISNLVTSSMASDLDREFSFTVILDDTSVNGTYGDLTFWNGVAECRLKGGESATSSGLSVGMGYVVTQEEADGFTTIKSGDSGTISVTPAQAEFTNVRKITEAEGEIKAKVNLTGREWMDGDSFTFTISAIGTTPKPEKTSVTVTKNSLDYVESFGKITFAEEGTYAYTVSMAKKGETINGVAYDSTDKIVTIKVKNDGNGHLVADGTELVQTAEFTNAYHATGSVTISASVAADEALGDQSFTFELLDKDGMVLQTGKSIKQGETGNYTAINYDQAEAGRTYTYKVRQVIPGGAIQMSTSRYVMDGVNYDGEIKEVTVTVTDNGDGTLSITCSGSPTTFTNKIKIHEVTASVADAKAEYNGSEQEGNTKVTFEGLLDGHVASIIYTPSEGSQANSYDNGSFDSSSFKVVDGGGKDMTAYYALGTLTAGKLTIEPRKVTVSVRDETKEYNGSEQTGSTGVVFENIVLGQTAIIGYVPPKGMLVNAYDNGSFDKNSFNVVDGEGKDVTANYVLGALTAGKLTITDRSEKYQIMVTANSNTANVYDGNEKSAAGFETLRFTVDGNVYVVEGLTTSDPRSINVCNLENAISGTAIVRDVQGNDVTAQFIVKTTNGKLEITARTVTVVADGKIKDTEKKDPKLTYTVSGLLGSDSLTGELTRQAGELPGTYAILQGTLKAGDNYRIHYVGAYLTILQGDYLDPLRELLKYAISLGGERTVTWDKGTGLTYDIMKTLQDHPQLTLIFRYNFANVSYEVTIRGMDVVTDPDVPWYGPMNLYGRYGLRISSFNPSTGERTYRVVRGDNLTKIARRFNVTVDWLVKKNLIKNPNLIWANQMLKY